MSDSGVSVIIPVFNRARMIADAIGSALDQSRPPLEVLVVDDGSTDDTASVARSFGPPVKVLRQANAGAAAARNTGLAAARGEFIAFLDSDDLWKPEKLAFQLDRLRSDPGLALVHSRVEWGEGFPEGYQGAAEAGAHYPDAHDAWPKLFAEGMLYTPCVLVRRAVIERTGSFDEDLSFWEDMNLWLRAALHGRIGLVEDRLTILRREADRSTRPDLSLLPVHWYRAYSRALDAARPHLSEEDFRRCRTTLLRKLDDRLVEAWWNGNRRALRCLCPIAMRTGPRRLRALGYWTASLLPPRGS